MSLGQAKYREPFSQIYLSPGGQLGMTHLLLLECHVEQALGLVGIAGIEDGADLSDHRRTLIEFADVALRVVLQVKLAALPGHTGKHRLAGRFKARVDCVDCLEGAMREHGNPEVFNSDQGTQFTSEAFTGVLKREAVTISMNRRGRAFDSLFVERLWRSVKHEDVYLNGYATMGELLIELTKYFVFYSGERAPQALENQTPDAVHTSSVGGGAMIVDKRSATLGLPLHFVPRTLRSGKLV